MKLVTILALDVVSVYAALGVLFAAAFHWRGLATVDGATHGTGIGFRLLITPGIIVLWPVLAWNWHRAASGSIGSGNPLRPVSPERLRRTHGLAWKLLAVLVPIALGWALALRPPSPATQASVLPASAQAPP